MRGIESRLAHLSSQGKFPGARPLALRGRGPTTVEMHYTTPEMQRTLCRKDPSKGCWSRGRGLQLAAAMPVAADEWCVVVPVHVPVAVVSLVW